MEGLKILRGGGGRALIEGHLGQIGFAPISVKIWKMVVAIAPLSPRFHRSFMGTGQYKSDQHLVSYH